MKKGAALMDVAIRKFHFLKCLNYQDFSVQVQVWKNFSQAAAVGVWLQKPIRKNNIFSLIRLYDAGCFLFGTKFALILGRQQTGNNKDIGGMDYGYEYSISCNSE